MQKVLLILVLVLFLAEQTTGQICSLEYCRGSPKSDCGCKGCCWGKLRCRTGRCSEDFNFPPPRPQSCFCDDCIQGVQASTSPTPE